MYRAARAEAEHGRGVVQRRRRTVNRGYGNKRHQEILATEVIGVTGLTVWEQYSDPAHKEQRRRRGFRPQPINAVVVRKWDNEDYGPGGQVVFLTNQPVDQPLAVFDDYDGRALIENVLFREGKQGWYLEAIPQKTQRAAVAHIFITFTMVALTTAFREWQRRQDEADAEPAQPPLALLAVDVDHDEPLGIGRWRRELEKRNRDYVIVFDGPRYGIFHVVEFSILSGLRLREIPPELGSREQIYARYGLSPPS